MKSRRVLAGFLGIALMVAFGVWLLRPQAAPLEHDLSAVQPVAGAAVPAAEEWSERPPGPDRDARVGVRNLLIRSVGPTLGVFGVPSVLADPKLEIYQGSTKIGENDNWASTLSTTFSSVGAFGLTQGSKDAAITVSLPAGGYTVQVSGADGGVGEALVEIYELP